MSAAQKSRLLVALAVMQKWPAIRMLLLALSCPGGYCAAEINIQTSAAPALFEYKLCGDDTDE